MKYLLSKDVKRLNVFLLTTFLCLSMACKKEVTEVSVDAFAQVNNEVKYNQGVYNVLFTLQEYPYKEVGVMLGTSKGQFHQRTDLITYPANEVGSNRYGIFLNSLTAGKTYYYQIYVKDSASAKVVYSDVFSFITNP